MVRKGRGSESNSSMLCAGLLALRTREKAWRGCPLKFQYGLYGVYGYHFISSHCPIFLSLRKGQLLVALLLKMLH